jgi:hypothetical protein
MVFLAVIGVLVAIAILSAPLVLSIIALVRTRRRDMTDERVDVLAERLGELERQVAGLHAAMRSGVAPETEAGPAASQTIRTPAPATYRAVAPELPSAEPTLAGPEAAEPPAAEHAEAVGEHSAAAEPNTQAAEGPEAEGRQPAVKEPSTPVVEPPAAEPWAEAEGPAPVQELTAAPAAQPGPEVAPEQSGAAPAAPREKRSIEEILGGQVFQKVGVAAIAIGVVFLLYMAAQQMGAAGKVAIGYLVAGVMLGGGLIAERRPRFRTFGRSLIAGGWGILYFVTFALHFMPQARLIDSPLAAILLMLAAAGGAVGFSLRYRSEWTTTFAFLLIYLTLGIAAWQTDAVFNLAATTIVSAGLAFLVWRAGWDRLLALGLAASWFVLSLWLVPQLLRLLERAHEGAQVPFDIPTLAALVATWAVFSAAILFRARRTTTHEGWQVAAYMANMFGLFGLGVAYVLAVRPDRAWIFPLATGIVYVAGAWAYKNRARRVLYLVSGTLGLVALALVSPLKLGWGSYWIPITRMLGIQVVLAAGMWLRERWFRGVAYFAFLFSFLEVLLFRLEPVPLPLAGGEIHFRLVILATAAVLALLDTALVRTTWREILPEGERRVVAPVSSFFGTLLLVLAAWLEVPELWFAPVLAVITFVWAAVGRFGRARDFDFEGIAVAVIATIGAIAYDLEPAATASGLQLRPLVLGILVTLMLMAYAVQRLPTEADDYRPAIAIAHSVFAVILVAVMVLLDVPEVWIAPTFMALMAVAFAIAFRLHLAELFYEGLAFTAFGVVALATVTWPLTGRIAGLPERPVSVSYALFLLYIGHHLTERFARAPGEEAPPALYAGSWNRFAILRGTLLALATVILFWWVKEEALTYGKNLLVALLWGLTGVLYLEVSRLKSSRTWMLHGHAAMLAALAHLYLVNFLQSGEIGPISLRVITCVPFFLFLLYVYGTWDGTTKPMQLGARVHAWKAAYLYAMVGVLATLIMYEVHRAWVIVGWAVLGVLATLRWRMVLDRHWRIIGLVLSVASAARGIAVNLYYRDEVLDWRLNLIAVPLACLLLLAAYAVLRQGELRGAADPPRDEESLARALRTPRMVWLASLVVLLTGFIWVEAAGTILTVWLSVEGLGLVALGFVARERVARLFGLLMLTGCILKLFIYDLRGLSGIPRILSFIVLGGVLIAVSFVYTRFKERIQEYL